MSDQLANLQRQLNQLRVYMHHLKCVDDGISPELWAAWRRENELVKRIRAEQEREDAGS